jgi:hypothetical protein
MKQASRFAESFPCAALSFALTVTFKVLQLAPPRELPMGAIRQHWHSMQLGGQKMTTRRSLKPIAAAWLLLGAITPSAYADPVTVPITSGLLWYPVTNPAILEVQFPNGSATVGWGDDNQEWVPDFFRGGCCTPGMRLNLSTDENFSGGPFPGFGGELRFGSEIYSVTSFNFSAVALRDINVPALGEGEGRTFTVPFTFRGVVSGSTASHRTLVLNLIGFGHASAVLEGVFPTHNSPGEARYAFEATPTPVPEPGTLLLFATGIGVGLRRMRRNLRE